MNKKSHPNSPTFPWSICMTLWLNHQNKSAFPVWKSWKSTLWFVTQLKGGLKLWSEQPATVLAAICSPFLAHMRENSNLCTGSTGTACFQIKIMSPFALPAFAILARSLADFQAVTAFPRPTPPLPPLPSALLTSLVLPQQQITCYRSQEDGTSCLCKGL